MRTDYRIKIIILLMAGLVFLAGLFRLFVLRFEAGDIYPHYSSLRADPLGTKAFYESLSGLKSIDVIRNYDREDKIENVQQSTLFYFGMPSDGLYYMSQSDNRMLENIAAGGGRVVLCLRPDPGVKDSEQNKGSDVNKEEKEKGDAPKEPTKKESMKKEDDRFKIIDLPSRWKFAVGVGKAGSSCGQAAPSPFLSTMFKKNISWHSAKYFKIDGGGEWIPIYELNGYPVIIERKFGRGSLVLATDSYFLSNEAMVKERYPELLAWIAGNNKKIIFDETHFGIREDKGIITLLREYNLEGFIIAILVLGMLFVWRHSYSLVPAEPQQAERKGDEIAEGRDYLSGFNGMLKRNISPGSLLSVCYDEWEKTIRHENRQTADKTNKIKSLIREHQKHRPQERSIIATYNTVSKILSERKYS